MRFLESTNYSIFFEEQKGLAVYFHLLCAFNKNRIVLENKSTLSKYIILILGITLIGCSTQRQLKKANTNYEIGEYNKAATRYKRAYRGVKDNTLRAETNYKLGNCYKYTNNINRAASAYSKAIRYNYEDPIIHLHYAEVLYSQNKLSEAKKNYQLYLQSDSSNTQAINGILACDSIAKWQLKTRYVVKIEKQFDSRRSSNFSPVLTSEDDELIYFTSSREGVTGGNAISNITGQRNFDILSISKDLDGKWKTPEPVAMINSEYDEGTPSFTADGKTMYFSSARHESGKSLGASIAMAQRKGAEWGEAIPVVMCSDSLADTLSFTHPAISSSGLQMYFVSDDPEGYGGLDIWFAKKEGESWSEPENLGPNINTSGDEMFPYLRNDTLLYYSSNGLPGFGGLDIYKASKDQDEQWTPKNMGSPINSKGDDFGISFAKDTERGYFSSNRNDRKGYDHIYSFYLPVLEFKFEGKVIDRKTKEAISGATIKLVGNDGTYSKISTKKDGTYSYPLHKETEYVFLATARGYLNKSGEMNTLNANKSIVHQKNFELSSIRQPIRLNNIFFDLGSAALTESSSASLDELVKTLEDNPNITIEVAAHSDAQGEETLNMSLSQKRAESVVNYLVKHSVAKDRLKAIGYGESQPVVADETLAEEYTFLAAGIVLNEAFINTLNEKEKEIAYSINRRTEFKVLSTTYKAKR